MIWDLQKWAGSAALVGDDGTELTYAELDSAGRAVAEAAGGRCLTFCLCRNEVGSIAGYVGFMQAGVVPVLLAAGLEEGLLDALLEAYRPAFVWAPADMEGRFPGMRAAHRALGYVLLDTRAGRAWPLHDDLALLLTTSGSTGSPKFVRQSRANVESNARAIAGYLALDEAERPITTLPMNYTYGLSIINSHLLVGATLLVTDKTLMQKEFWTFFRERGATSFGGVPYTYEMLDKLRFARMDLPSLRTMTQAGGKLLPDLHEKFARYAQETGKRFVVMYGQCEATARMGYLPPERALEKKGSMGVAIPGGAFRLVGADGAQVTEPHVTGELVYEGPNVTMGYAERGEDLSLGDERGGVLETGDMAQFDEDGFYYIVGRKKRFLKIFGNRVNLDEAERLVKAEFGAEAACSGVDDHMDVYVTDEALAAPVAEFLARKTGLNPVAFKARVIAEIPKNDSGKTLYRELDAMSSAGGK